MNLSFFIAKRYLVSKKSHNIINVISAISAIGVMAGTMALIIILSVFNGFEDLVKSLFNTFNPDIQISSKEGKTFQADSFSEDEIMQIPGIISYSKVIQESALLKYGNEQFIATIKGVNENYLTDNPLQEVIVEGAYPEKGSQDFAILGYGVALNLGINLIDFTKPIDIYLPRRTKKNFNLLNNSFNRASIIPSAVFSLQQEIDNKYVILPFHLLQELLEYNNEISHIEIRLEDDANVKKVKSSIEHIVGKNFHIKDRYQQEELLYKIMKSEKWAIFFILAFIIVIAAFNLIGSLSMIILDKKKDIAILFGMGVTVRTIKKIFITNGLLINISGVIIGLFLGIIFCFLQQEFGLIKLGSNSEAFIIPYYPVQLKFIDFINVFTLVLVIGIIASWFSVRKISKKYLEKNVTIYTRAY